MVQHPWHEVAIGPNPPEILNAIIEIPSGSRAKYEIDKPSGLIKLDRVIYASMYYPLNYGFIPQTLGEDHDPLDIGDDPSHENSRSPSHVKRKRNGRI